MWSEKQDLDDPAGGLDDELQRLGLEPISPERVIDPRILNDTYQTDPDPTFEFNPSTPNWSHAHPELPPSPTPHRVQPIDIGNAPLPIPDFGTGQWSVSDTGNAQSTERFPPSPSLTSSVPKLDHDNNTSSDGDRIGPHVSLWKIGSCRCGNVVITISGPPTVTFLCHCDNCKKVFASHLVSLARYKFEDIDVLNRGDLRFFLVDDVAYYFCGTCGSVFFLKIRNNPDVAIPTALLDDDYATLYPRMEIFCAQQTVWLPALAPPPLRYDYAPPPFTSHLDWSPPENI